MYHGAEHKTIFCYEKGLPLTVENVKMQKRFHPRCGTSFLILMILVSVIFSTLVQIIFPSVYNIEWLWVVIKILLLPLICGVGFEVLRFCGKYDNIITKIIYKLNNDYKSTSIISFLFFSSFFLSLIPYSILQRRPTNITTKATPALHSYISKK